MLCHVRILSTSWPGRASSASFAASPEHVSQRTQTCRWRLAQATRAYLHAGANVERALNAAGFTVVKREMTATSFYFSRLLEAVRL